MIDLLFGIAIDSSVRAAVLAAAIALRLGRPNRQTWYVAALLSGYVLFNAAIAILRLADQLPARKGDMAER